MDATCQSGLRHPNSHFNKLCGGSSRDFAEVDFNKFCSSEDTLAFGRSGVAVPYERCDACKFIFTRFFDDWTAEDFKNFVYNKDYILIDPEYAGDRPTRDAQWVSVRLGKTNLRLLDYGSGTGVFARSLSKNSCREAVSFDPFSSPIRPTGRFDMATCIEVIEHSTDPLTMMKDLLSHLEPGGCVLLGTTLQPSNIEEIRGAWWYIGPRNGHVSIFSQRALQILAENFGLQCFSFGSVHLLTSASPSAASKRLLHRLQQCNDLGKWHRRAKRMLRALVRV